MIPETITAYFNSFKGRELQLLYVIDRLMEDGQCETGIVQLSSASCLPRRTVMRLLTSLEELNVITVHRSSGKMSLIKYHPEVVPNSTLLHKRSVVPNSTPVLDMALPSHTMYIREKRDIDSGLDIGLERLIQRGGGDGKFSSNISQSSKPLEPPHNPLATKGCEAATGQTNSVKQVFEIYLQFHWAFHRSYNKPKFEKPHIVSNSCRLLAENCAYEYFDWLYCKFAEIESNGGKSYECYFTTMMNSTWVNEFFARKT